MKSEDEMKQFVSETLARAAGDVSLNPNVPLVLNGGSVWRIGLTCQQCGEFFIHVRNGGDQNMRALISSTVSDHLAGHSTSRPPDAAMKKGHFK